MYGKSAIAIPNTAVLRAFLVQPKSTSLLPFAYKHRACGIDGW
jgi:hypothetical protein